jgi:phosphatidylserine/phosphatidylglycerophosphate/cardiolipin synthase-like enzyme
VAVRVILDQNLEKSSNTTAYTALGAANVGVHWANPTYAATHQKTITVDGTVSAVMSLNLATEDYKTSRDFAVFTTDAADVAAIEAVFASDFIDAPVTPGNGDDLVWSPTNSQSSLVGIIGGAKASLLVENEEMGDSSIVSALAGAASRGVDVQVVMENSSSYQSEFTTLVNAGVKLVTYAHSALYIHAKVILADYGASGARVFIGSENFSNASLTENRELGLVTTDAGIMASIHGTLTSDFAGGTTFKPSASSADAGP